MAAKKSIYRFDDEYDAVKFIQTSLLKVLDDMNRLVERLEQGDFENLYSYDDEYRRKSESTDYADTIIGELDDARADIIAGGYNTIVKMMRSINWR